MLDEGQVLNALQLLELPLTEGAEIFYRPQEKVLVRARVAREQLAALTPGREALCIEILEQYAPIKYDTDTLKTQGLDSSAGRTRAKLRGDLERLLGLPSSGSSGGIKLGRG